MRVVAGLLILVVLGITVAVTLGWGDRLVSVPVDRAPAGWDPDEGIHAAAVPRLRFNIALRGYRMAEVDEVLARLADALHARDSRIAELESGAAEAGRLDSVTFSTDTPPTPGPDLPPPFPPAPPGPGPGPEPAPPGPQPPLEPPTPAGPAVVGPATAGTTD